jgi:deoxyadenosine/deoxycytidine kinase
LREDEDGSSSQFRVFFCRSIGDADAMTRTEHCHVAVEGCIGVGKTTLATKLAQFRRSQLVLEQFEKNPFLEKFYQDPAETAFETESQFLLLHYHQLKAIHHSAQGETITDFTFFKDLVFANTNIADPAEETMFLCLYQFLAARLSSPDLIIYLKGSNDLIIERIQTRKRAMELEIDVGYFKKLNKAYDEFFTSSPHRVHIIHADKFDCLSGTDALEQLSSTIDSLLRREIAA